MSISAISASTTATTATTDNKIYDKMDTNRDGTVSDQERLEYNMTQSTDTTATSSVVDIVELSSKSSTSKTSSTDSKTYDKKDVNKDGVVTAQEKLAASANETTDTSSPSLTSPYSNSKSKIQTYA